MLVSLCLQCAPESAPSDAVGTDEVCSVHEVPLQLGAGVLPPEPPFTPQYVSFMEDRGHHFPNAFSLPNADAAVIEERYTAQVQFCAACREALEFHSLDAFR